MEDRVVKFKSHHCAEVTYLSNNSGKVTCVVSPFPSSISLRKKTESLKESDHTKTHSCLSRDVVGFLQ